VRKCAGCCVHRVLELLSSCCRPGPCGEGRHVRSERVAPWEWLSGSCGSGGDDSPAYKNPLYSVYSRLRSPFERTESQDTGAVAPRRFVAGKPLCAVLPLRLLFVSESFFVRGQGQHLVSRARLSWDSFPSPEARWCSRRHDGVEWRWCGKVAGLCVGPVRGRQWWCAGS